MRVASVDGEEKPWNCAVKSSNCFWRDETDSASDDAALRFDG